jgi:hypothetical protein
MAKRDPTDAIKLVLDSGRAVNTADLAEELISAFGGSKKFAGQYKLEFDGAKAGSISRSKMLDGVLRVVTAAGSQNKGKSAGDPSGMSDDELMGEIGRMLAARGIGAKTDGEPEKAAAG